MSGPEAPRPWGIHDVSDGQEVAVDVGPLELRFRRSAQEIWLAHRREERTDRSGPVEAETTEWSRWALPPRDQKVALRPALPDRALVVEPEQIFHLLRGARVRIYVRVPLRVRIEIPGDPPLRLLEVPTLTLSDTWFGDFAEGELAYAVPTRARQAIGEADFESHLAICPLQLVNGAGDDLEVKKIALRTAHLSLFARGREMWSDETRVHHRGEEVGSDLRMTGEPPPEAPDASLVAPPRTPAVQGLRARTFARLKGLPGLGSQP